MNLDYFRLPDLATKALLLMCHMCSQVVNLVKFRAGEYMENNIFMYNVFIYPKGVYI